MTREMAGEQGSGNRSRDSHPDSAHLEELLDHVAEAGDADSRCVSVKNIVEVIGSRSFSPLLMLVGLLILSPLSGIPTLPTVAAAAVLLVTVQMLLGRRHFWFPDRLLKAEVPRSKLNAALKWLQPVARFVDRITRPRLALLVKGPANYLIAVVCLLLACLMPLMELIPFSSSAAGAVLAMFGVAMVSKDGLMALLAYLVLGAATGLVIATLV